MYDVAVIGGGAAGMLASGLAARKGLRVLLIEKNEKLGVKLRITGKGRCNVTNDCAVREALEHIPTGGKFLYSAFSCFAPKDTMAFFEGLGVPLKTERGNRVFPVSDRAGDIAAALGRFMDKSGVEIRRGTVRNILVRDGAVEAVVTDKERVDCRTVILCTGGVSYPLTGSTGDGYRIVQGLGHTVVPPKASLVPLEAAKKPVKPGTGLTSREICAGMQGLSLRNVRLTVTDGGKKPVFEDFGELLFTHFGLSGPLVLSASAHMRDFEHKIYRASIDLKPALDEKKLDARLLRDFEKYANKDFSNALGDLLNRTMIPFAVELSNIPPETKVHSITRAQRAALLALLKDFSLEIAGLRPVDEAIVTSGGISTREIDPKTMASKLVSGLYFAGEIIDADAYTGGFNLQIAWSTAYAAASHLPSNEPDMTLS